MTLKGTWLPCYCCQLDDTCVCVCMCDPRLVCLFIQTKVHCVLFWDQPMMSLIWQPHKRHRKHCSTRLPQEEVSNKDSGGSVKCRMWPSTQQTSHVWRCGVHVLPCRRPLLRCECLGRRNYSRLATQQSQAGEKTGGMNILTIQNRLMIIPLNMHLSQWDGCL